MIERQEYEDAEKKQFEIVVGYEATQGSQSEKTIQAKEMSARLLKMVMKYED